ncbi:AAA family ATPase [Streptomyces sp. AS02]|uniref:AAA family ATPase n=1 Tax=Streptomyces sp. AS02 TaxID=2938946 RepID=UPI002020F8AB|nr:AAA family ATPase [Streptomyces sp. AS02]MCL8010265.1 caspase family protein [Streptomyces sp. AS02]
MSDGTAPGDAGPRRFLIATAVSHYPHAPEWDRPGLAEARRRIVDLFTTKLGYEHVSDLGASPTQQQLLWELREFCRSPERRADDILAVYIAGHGELLDNDEYVLLTSDTHPDDLYDALPPSTLARKILAGTKVRRLLLMLDTCFSGQGGNELLVSMAKLKGNWRERDAGLAVITSAQPSQLARTGAFPELLTEAVTSLATAGCTPALLSLDAVVNATAKNPSRPDFQDIGLEIIGLTGEIPPFLPNAKHSNRLSHTDMALQQAAEWDEQDRRRDVEFRTRLLRRAMGHRDEDRVGWWFSGRHRALRDITAWLGELPDERPALVVTGDPGSGKTAVLGLLAAVSDPEYRRTVPLANLGLRPELLPPPKAIRTAVYAQSLTDQQVVQALAAALRLPPVEAVAELLNQLNAAPEPDRPRVVLIDGLDEAVTPRSLCNQVLRPLMELAGTRLRLLLGTRPHLLAPLAVERADHVDLDAPRYADPQAVLAYAVRNLIDAHPKSPYLDCENGLRLGVARAVAAAAGHSFLVARITAGTLAATPTLPDPQDPDWLGSLPSAAADAMHRDLHQRFGEGAERILDLLRPLAYAEGQGLPWEDIWAPLASEVSGRRYTNEDLHQLRRDAGAYVVEAVEDGRSVYRLYHEAMAEYLRLGRDAGEAHRAFTVGLRRTVPYRIDGALDWGRAHPYALRHLAVHAAHAGLLDGLVTEPEYLVHADADTLVLLLLRARSDTARLHAAVYRASIRAHRHLDPVGRRRILSLDAARYNEPSLLEAFGSGAAERTWKPVAASGSLLTGNLLNAFTVPAWGVIAMACTVLDGREVVVTGSLDTTLRIWDLATGQPIGRPMTGHTKRVEAVVCTTLDGRPIAVSGSSDGTVRVWDLATGQPVGKPMTGHTKRVEAVACTTLDGRPIAVTGADTLRVWDLATGEPVSGPIDVDGRVSALTVAVVQDSPVAVVRSRNAGVRVWDLTSRLDLGGFESAAGIRVTALVGTELDGRPAVVGLTQGSKVHVWSLETRQRVAAFEWHDAQVHAVACTQLEDRPVVVASFRDRTLSVWDLKARRRVGGFGRFSDAVTSLACTSLAGRPVAVRASLDAVHVWDLSVSQPLGRPVTGHTHRIAAVDVGELNGRPVFVTVSHDQTVRIWDASTGAPIGESLKGHRHDVRSVACTTLRGRPIAVTASLDGTVGVWDLERQAAHAHLTGHSEPVTRVTCDVLDGRPVAIGSAQDDSLWTWDLETGKARYRPLHDAVGARRAMATTVVAGRLIAITSGEGVTQFRDLATRRSIAEIQHSALAIACGRIGGRPVVVTCGRDATVQVRDLGTGRLLGRPMTGHGKPAYSVRCGSLDGRPVAVTCSVDDTVRIWDLESCTSVGILHVPELSEAVLLDDTGRLACAFGNDVAIFARQ